MTPNSPPANTLCDIPGIQVGHLTLDTATLKTGVTVILPGPDIFQQKLPAACHIINGYGKSLGLMQIAELGTLESPIALTNTLSVGAVHEGLTRWLLAKYPQIGRPGTVNPVVCECNDGRLNDIRQLAVRPEHVLQALEFASEQFAQGAVGAGRGMVCYGLKGGIGSASCAVLEKYRLGALVLTNMGAMQDLCIHGDTVGQRLAAAQEPQADHGSIIVILATDAPLDARQLGRVCRRAQNGIARTGARTGHGSGEVVIAFSTAQAFSEHAISQRQYLREDLLDPFFSATAELVESAILNSLYAAVTTVGYDGTTIQSLSDRLSRLTESKKG